MKIKHILAWSILLGLALAVSLYVSSRATRAEQIPQVKRDLTHNSQTSPDVVPYEEVKHFQTTVCSIVKDPSAFVSSFVTFTANVRSDCRHGTLLVDNSCGRGLSFSVPNPVEDQWKPIGDVMCIGLGRESKDVRGTFTGRLVKKSDTADGQFPYRVELSAIEDVQTH